MHMHIASGGISQNESLKSVRSAIHTGTQRVWTAKQSTDA